MICYFDTSAFVPLLIAEPGSPACADLWNAADAVVSSRLLHAETAAALAQAERLGRVTAAEYTQARELLDDLWTQIHVLDTDQELVERAADLARSAGPGGHDAVHCACAERLKSGDLVVAPGDRRLLEACASLGLSVSDTSSPR
ncbi:MULTISPECIES: type II toxin-antitoxin system VapC family toxin [unclassified Nocardiopsis]|uniref:type II toxin-antitoxin system VapC family toxin n=1 Tax=Nocardiopsis TaxID=2013 RepID=UPI00387AEE4A